MEPIAASPAWDPELTKFRKADQAQPSTDSVADTSPQLHLLVRNGDQLDAALAAAVHTPIASITLDYLELYGLRPAVEKIRAANVGAEGTESEHASPAHGS